MRDSKRDTDVQNGLLDSEGEGEGGMIWENGNETCLLSCKKRSASLCSIQNTGCLGLVQRMIQREDMGWEVGGGFRMGACIHPWWIHVNVWQNLYSIVK